MSPRRSPTPGPAPPRGHAPRTRLTAPEFVIAEGFKVAYDGAAGERRRLRVVEEYVAEYAHIAFHPDSWLVALWMTWRGLGKDSLGPGHREAKRQARVGLRAIQRGIVAPTSGYVGGWVVGPRRRRALRAAAVVDARAAVREVRQDARLKTAYRHWRQARNDPEYRRYLVRVGQRAWQLLVGFDPAAPPPSSTGLAPEVAEALLVTWRSRHAVFVAWIEVFQADIRDRGLSRALNALVARVHRIPERDLH